MNVEQIFRTRVHCKECIDFEKCRLPLAEKFGDKGQPPQSQDRKNREFFTHCFNRFSRFYLAVFAVQRLWRSFATHYGPRGKPKNQSVRKINYPFYLGDLLFMLLYLWWRLGRCMARRVPQWHLNKYFFRCGASLGSNSNLTFAGP